MSSVVKVVAPEELIDIPLQIAPVNTCGHNYHAGSELQLKVTNANVIPDPDQTGLNYKWTVSGAAITADDDSILIIPQLPGAGNHVNVHVAVTNTAGVGASGTLQFTVAPIVIGIQERLGALDCNMRQYTAINRSVPLWVPVENGDPTKVRVNVEQVERIVAQAEKIVVAGQSLLSAAKVSQSVEAINLTEISQSPLRLDVVEG
jgi:hypothetical protein